MRLQIGTPMKQLLNRSFSSSLKSSYQTLMSSPLKEVDTEAYNIMENERIRQLESICLIPSENFTSMSVLDSLGSWMQNKYSEGYPGERYYGGNEFIDQMELLCQKRALELYNLDPKEWGVNCQALSGSPANLFVYAGVVGKGNRLVGFHLIHGGHLSHGFESPTRKVSYSADYYEWMHYYMGQDALIDYNQMQELVTNYRPKMLVAGYSAYSRNYDYKKMREVADSVGAYLFSDMAHISGLVATGNAPNPFEYSDIVTTTTHKTLQGPRGALIFYRLGERSKDKKGNVTMYDLKEKIDAAVFPGFQGGPHNHTITAIAVALRNAKSPEFKYYVDKVVENSKAMVDQFQSKGYDVVTGGTDNHMSLIDLRPKGIDGARAEWLFQAVNISTNKNMVPGDKSAMKPSGVRVGSPCMTARGFGVKDFHKTVDYIDEAVKLAFDIKKGLKSKKLKDFKAMVGSGNDNRIKDLKGEISEFCRGFDFPYEKK